MSGEFSRDEDRLLGTGEQLNAHIDEWVATVGRNRNGSDDFNVAMGKKLAERIGDGVIPMGYVVATELLTHDCLTGVDRFTGERLQSSIVSYPPVMYGLFRIRAEQFARGAFGEDFGDQVSQISADITARLQQQTDPTQG